MDKKSVAIITLIALGAIGYYLYSKENQQNNNPVVAPQQHNTQAMQPTWRRPELNTQNIIQPFNIPPKSEKTSYIVTIYNNMCSAILVGVSWTLPSGVKQFTYLHSKSIIRVRANDTVTFHFYGYKVDEEKTVKITSDTVIYVGQKTPWKPGQQCSTELIMEQVKK